MRVDLIRGILDVACTMTDEETNMLIEKLQQLMSEGAYDLDVSYDSGLEALKEYVDAA